MMTKFSLAGRQLAAQLRQQRSGEISYRQLAARLRVHRQTAIKLLAQLESAGLIEVYRRGAPWPNSYEWRG